MQFVRGESTDDEVKGGRYAWGAGQPRRGFAAPISWPPRKRPRPGGGADQDEDDERYFDGDDDEKPPPTAAADMDDPLDAYMAQLDGQQSAPKRPAPSVQQRAAAPAAEEEEDPLDAFMAGIEKKAAAAPAPSQRAAAAAVQQCDEADDHIASFLEEREAAAAAADAEEDDAEEGRAGGPRKQLGRQQAGKQLELLPVVDHDELEYAPFAKELYKPHPTIRGMSDAEVATYRTELALRCTGFDVPAPIRRFEHVGLSRELMQVVRRQGFEQPTPVQCQALPAALSGRDLIAVATTGSGKTASYLLPAIMHVMAQPELAKGDGPVVLVIVPTHELCEQVAVEARKFSKGHGLRVTGVFGGVGKYEQIRELKAGSEIVVGTPGRLLELIGASKGTLPMRRVTYVVADEADRMFSLGFEPQVRSVLSQIRPDRQTLLFSATFKPALERLARDVLTEPLRLTIGNVGDANEDVTQVIEVLPSDDAKWGWLAQRLEHFLAQGTLLIFVSTRASTEDLARSLTRHTGHRIEAIHGDRSQAERQEVLRSFKRGQTPILVATDVASRGLDIHAIKTVVSLDVARRIDDHTHRIGRVGRASATDGVAYTLLTQGEADAAVDMVRSLRSAKQAASPELLQLAERSRRWAASGLASGDGGRGGSCGGGGGGSGSGEISRAEFAPPPSMAIPARPRPAGVGCSSVAEAAQAAAARLSAQMAGIQGHVPHAAMGVAVPPPPPVPSACNQARAAAQAAAQSLSARLATSTAPVAPPYPPPPPPLPPPPPHYPPPAPSPPPSRPSRWS